MSRNRHIADGTLQQGTAQSLSGSTVTFSGLPSWVRQVTLVVSNMSGSAGSEILLRVGDHLGVRTTGYKTGARYFTTGTNAYKHTDRIGRSQFNAAADAGDMVAVFTKLDGFKWSCQQLSFIRTINASWHSIGTIELDGPLTTISMSLAAGSFDAGTANILYE